MNIVKGLPRLWNGYWFEEISPYPIAAFRILFGLFLFWYFARHVAHVPLLFSNEGVYVPYAMPDYAPGPIPAWMMFTFTLIVNICFIIGWRTQVVSSVLFLCYLYYFFLNFALPNYSYDRVNIQFLLILLFTDFGPAWSLTEDQAQKNGRTSKFTVTAWATRLLAFDVAIMYFGSGLWKVFNPSWRTGEIIKYTYLGLWGTPQSMWFVRLQWPGWFYDGLVFGVIAFELSLGFLLYWKRSRTIAVILGTIFHLSNWFFLDIPEFMAFVAVYVLFLDGEQVKRAGDYFTSLWRRFLRRPLGPATTMI